MTDLPPTVPPSPRPIPPIPPVRIRARRACRHAHKMWTTTGGIYFTWGDVDDDIHDELVCLDCGEILNRDGDKKYHGRPIYARPYTRKAA